MQEDPAEMTGPGGEKDSGLSNTVTSQQRQKSFIGNIGSYLKARAAKRKRRKKEKSDDPYIYPMF